MAKKVSLGYLLNRNKVQILTFFKHQEVYGGSGNRVIITIPVWFVEDVRLVGLGSLLLTAVTSRLPPLLSTKRRRSTKITAPITTLLARIVAKPWLLAIVCHPAGPWVRPLHVFAVVRICQYVTAYGNRAQQRQL